ncbi:MAG: hypothetical protein JWO36_4009 [Myxococcales bacterium]|nr:hypothetical protein [Myxococcales bacterium]
MSSHWAFAACCVLTLAGCPTVDLGDTPPDIGLCNPKRGIDYFQSDVWPKYLAPTDMTKSCTRLSSCHGNGGTPSWSTQTPINYPANYRIAQGYLNCGNPMASYLLTKPLAGQDGHQGGDIFPDLNDPAVQTFLMWFQ